MSDFGGVTVTPDYDVPPGERTLAMAAHVGAAILCCIAPLVPLVIWLMKKDQSRFISENAKQALAFTIGWWVLGIALGIVKTILAAVFAPLALIAMIVTLPVGLIGLAYLILGGIRANEGKVFQYPITSQFVK